MNPQDTQAPEQGNAIADAVRLFSNHWAIMVSAFVTVGLFGAYKAFVEPALYRAEAMIQVELRNGRSMDPTAAFLGMDVALSSAEIELIQSRSVAAAAVGVLDSSLVYGPRYWGHWGAAMGRVRANRREPAAPWFGLHEYAWGGELLKIERFDVPDKLRGRDFTLIATVENAYELRAGRTLLAVGRAGLPLKFVSPEGEVILVVSELLARSGTEFLLRREAVDKAADRLRSRIRVEEKGRGTGILMVRVEGPGPDRVAAEANAIVEAYLQRNVERRSEEAQKRLDFLNSQLPRLKDEVALADSKLREFRSKKETASLSTGGEAQLAFLTDVESKLSAAELDLAEVRGTLTEQHPSVQALRQRVGQLRAEKQAGEKELTQLPALELDLIKLTRDSKIANDLYLLLLNKAQELKVAKAGTIGNVFIIDRANPNYKPIKPDRRKTLSLYLLLGAVLGVIFATIRQALHTRILSGDEIEMRLGVPVFAVIPTSLVQGKLLGGVKRKATKKLSALALEAPKDLATESLRSLRASLQFAAADVDSKIITFTGAAPGVGKTFINLNMAVLMAEAGRRTLLIDGDLRKGRLHDYAGIPRSPGLSELIAGTVEPQKAIHSSAEIPTLHFLASGKLPPNPSELLGNQKLAALLMQFSAEYDLIIIDSPPVMNLADALIISRLSGVTFMVVRERQSTWREMELAIARYARDGLKVKGIVVNGVRFSRSRYGYYAYPYAHYGK